MKNYRINLNQTLCLGKDKNGVDYIELTPCQMSDICHFYEKECTKEYIMENYPEYNEDDADTLAYETRRIMDKYGLEEEEAIEEAINNFEVER